MHTFYPLLYMFCRTECRAAYEQLFLTLREVPSALFGLAGHLVVSCGSLDRSSYIADAYMAVWPQIKLLLDWAHLARKFKEGDFLKKLADKNNLATIEKHVHHLHNCRSRPQFDELADFILNVWTQGLDEGEFARKFRTTYTGEPWGNWHVTVSGIPGVLPTQQGIENGHKVQKLVIGKCALCACARRLRSQGWG